MYIQLEEKELEALQGTDYALTALYIHIKQFMDYKTGIVGYARRISYQSMSEALYIEPRAGVKGGSPSRSALRRMIDQLLKIKLLSKGRADTLVFKLPYADTQNYVKNKADINPTPHADIVKATDSNTFEPQADIPKKPKADIPHSSLNTINKAASASKSNVLQIPCQVSKNAAAADILIFHKSLSTEAQKFMLNATSNIKHNERQILFDELAGFLEKKKVKSNPMGLFLTFIGQAQAGTFIPVYAGHIRNLRENPPAVEKPKAAPTAQDKEAKKEKGRAAMANVQQLFKRKTS